MAKSGKEKCRVSLEQIDNGWKVVCTTETETLSSKKGWIPPKYETKENAFPTLDKALAHLKEALKDCDKK